MSRSPAIEIDLSSWTTRVWMARLMAARDGPREHEARHVRADDENDQADRGHQHPQRLFVLGAPLGESAAAGDDVNGVLLEAFVEL